MSRYSTLLDTDINKASQTLEALIKQAQQGLPRVWQWRTSDVKEYVKDVQWDRFYRQYPKYILFRDMEGWMDIQEVMDKLKPIK